MTDRDLTSTHVLNTTNNGCNARHFRPIVGRPRGERFPRTIVIFTPVVVKSSSSDRKTAHAQARRHCGLYRSGRESKRHWRTPQLLERKEGTPENSTGKMVVRKIRRMRREALNDRRLAATKKPAEDSHLGASPDGGVGLSAQLCFNHVVKTRNTSAQR